MLFRVYRGANDPFDPFGSLSVPTLRWTLFTNGVLHSLGRLRKISAVDVIEGVSRCQRSVRCVRIVKCAYAPLNTVYGRCIASYYGDLEK